MNAIQRWLGIKSPSAEAAKEADVIMEFVIKPFLEGVRIGMSRNCRCAIVLPQAPPQPKYWDVKASRVFEDISPERHQMRKWLSQIPHGGIVGDSAVLIMYNKQAPEQSEMIVEGINS